MVLNVRLFSQPVHYLPHENAGMSPLKTPKKIKCKIHYNIWRKFQRKRCQPHLPVFHVTAEGNVSRR
jgi:hypothetical protein